MTNKPSEELVSGGLPTGGGGILYCSRDVVAVVGDTTVKYEVAGCVGGGVLTANGDAVGEN